LTSRIFCLFLLDWSRSGSRLWFNGCWSGSRNWLRSRFGCWSGSRLNGCWLWLGLWLWWGSGSFLNRFFFNRWCFLNRSSGFFFDYRIGLSRNSGSLFNRFLLDRSFCDWLGWGFCNWLDWSLFNRCLLDRGFWGWFFNWSLLNWLNWSLFYWFLNGSWFFNNRLLNWFLNRSGSFFDWLLNGRFFFSGSRRFFRDWFLGWLL
jgi:hypothetical protein